MTTTMHRFMLILFVATLFVTPMSCDKDTRMFDELKIQTDQYYPELHFYKEGQIIDVKDNRYFSVVLDNEVYVCGKDDSVKTLYPGDQVLVHIIMKSKNSAVDRFLLYGMCIVATPSTNEDD